MQDSFGNELSVGVVVETFGAYNKCDNAMWVVTNIYEDGEISLERLNKDMRKAKTNARRSWPFRSWLNNHWKNVKIDLYNRENARIRFLCPWVEPEKKAVSDKISFQKRGIKKGDTYCSCWYNLNSNGTISIYARHYNQHIPREIGCVENNSDSMTDYFETDSAVLTPDNPYYQDALRCCSK